MCGKFAGIGLDEMRDPNRAAGRCRHPVIAETAWRRVTLWKVCGKQAKESGLIELPPVDRYRLARPPLAQALAQVRFPLVAGLQSLAGIAPLQERFETTFPYMSQNQVQELSFLIGPAGAAAPQTGTALVTEFTDDEGRLLSIHPGSATLSMGATYDGIEDFAERFSDVLRSLSEVVGVRRCDRLGVRYLNTVGASSNASWRSWFRTELVGWAASQIVAAEAMTQSSVSQTQLAGAIGSVDAQAIVRHGLAPTGSTLPGVPPVTVSELTFFLDFDFFVTGPQRFAPESILAQFRVLHDQIDRFFRWSLTSAGADYFGLED